MTIEIVSQYFDDLSEAEKSEVSNNGRGREYANYLRVLHNGEKIGLYSDAMEPEDATFSRDLKWIKDIILVAYDLGLKDQA